MSRDWEDRLFCVFGWVVAALLVGLVAFLIYAGGYGLGIWPASCRMFSDQPQCIAHGWNGGTVNLKTKP